MAFYFVSQRNQKNENEMGKLTAPDNKKYRYIKNTRKDDLIIQYNSVSRCITGVACANTNPYVSDDNIYIDVYIYTFAIALPKNLWIKQLREKQNGLKTPVNENLSINSRYLQRMNAESFNYILDVAEKNSANKDVVQKIRNMSKLTPSYDIDDTSYDDENDEGNVMQKIFFGAPGTGKSHTIKSEYLVDVSEDNIFRTTFHPDYDYAQFVGSYKPKKDADGKITYEFVPQVFAKAYAAAYRSPDQSVYLIIEEINRGNCAQIFGDIFQLLDRKNGESEYIIEADADFAQWLVDIAKVPGHSYDENGCVKIKLPPNFNILATMNTSDQSLFPMDSAFKRRFDWEYVPISFEGKSAANFQIEIGSSENVKYYSWQTFVEKVNAKILDLTESEDKQLGEYFIQPDKKLNDSDTEKTVISEERFKGKVMFYLWNEICKDEHKNGSFFKIENDFFTFQDLYKDDSKLAAFMEEIEKTGKN